MEETIQKAQAYKDLDTQLTDWLSDAEKRVDDITNQPVDVGNADAIKSVSDDLSHIDAEIETNKANLNKLKGMVVCSCI